LDDFGKTIEKYTSLSELCMDSKSDLETIIEEIDAFLIYWGERLQHGMISDIDYFRIIVKNHYNAFNEAQYLAERIAEGNVQELSDNVDNIITITDYASCERIT